jgi:Xaa-Pro aminopeptidase
MTASLPAMDIPGRLPRLRQRLEEAGCQALLVTHLPNLRYLTGFTGSAGLLLVMPDEVVFVTDGRYGEQAAEQLAGAGVDARLEIHTTPAGQRDAVSATASGVERLGLEADAVTWAASRRYGEEWFPTATLVPTEGLVEALRELKDDGEVARVGEAGRIADEALARVRPLLGQHPTEREFGLALDAEMRRLGADDVSFDTIVGSGPNGARPHARPTPRRIGEGDLVVLDFGALVDGYHSDMTRTVMVGPPSPTQGRMLETVAASQAAGVAAVAPGVACADVDRTCRDLIAEAGWADAFVHGTGHGVGLDIHESPRVSSTSTGTLAAGHVITVEPGVYLADHGGVRIEDTVVVTATGCRALTHSTKDVTL